MFNKKTFGKIEFYIDYSNVFHYQKCLKNKVNIIDVIQKLQKKFPNIIGVRFYNGLRTLNKYEKDFLKKIIQRIGTIPEGLVTIEDKIKSIGYRHVIEFIGKNYQQKEELIRKLKDRSFLIALEKNNVAIGTKKVKNISGKDKANFDVEITADALLRKEFYDTLVLFSGDWDFVYLLDVLTKQFKKKVLIVSLDQHIAEELRHYNGADSYLRIVDLLAAIGLVNEVNHICKKTP